MFTLPFLPCPGRIRNRRRLAFLPVACSPDQILTYAQNLRVSHADVDFLGELKVSSLLGTLEQAAVEASAAGGFDPERYTADGRVWLVRRTRLDRAVPVGGGDSLAISTHVADFRRARSLRRYEVRRTEGYEGRDETPAATASTDWVYCDVASGRPVSVPDEMKLALFGTTDTPTAERAPRVTPPDEAPADVFTTRVLPSHLDHMQHVNNAVWADFLEDAAFALFEKRGLGLGQMLEEGGALRMRRLDLEYLGDARLDQSLEVQTWLPDQPGTPGRNPTLVQTIGRADGQRLLRAESQWCWRERPAVLGGIPEP